MGLFSDKTKRMAAVHGVTPEALPHALKQSEQERQGRDKQFQRSKAITDAHAAGQSCGGDCQTCRNRGLI
ncbi:hypothetical protein ABZ738_05410 [Micromonospora sp. NPDC047793]|uniref:hypothetical protein n=1 Tax=Micromonospora sp. NPDC047793 TaxID=3154342 RepID=UPI00340A286B